MNMKQRSFAPSSHENEKAKSAWNNEKNGDVKPGDIIIMKDQYSYILVLARTISITIIMREGNNSHKERR